MAIKFVKQSVSTVVDGSRVRLTKDDPWRADDPVVVALPEFFRDEPSKVQSSAARVSAKADEVPADEVPADQAEQDAPVEAATAEPGIKRTTRARKSAKG